MNPMWFMVLAAVIGAVLFFVIQDWFNSSIRQSNPFKAAKAGRR